MSASSTINARPPLLPWAQQTWDRWAAIPRLHKAPILRTKFLLLKAPVSTLYEEKFHGDRNMFTVPMYASRMTALGIDVGMVIDCTVLDLEAFSSLPKSSPSPVRYFHDVNEWQEFDIEYTRIPSSSSVHIENRSTTTPNQSHIDQFLLLCSQHWSKSPDTFIAVFDSRGGYGIASYLICCYMCVHMKAPVHVALASLEKTLSTSTGTGLLDITLIRDLQSRFHGTKEILFDSSKIPAWWHSPTEDASLKANASLKGDKDAEAIVRIQPLVEQIVPSQGTTTTLINNQNRKRSRSEETNLTPALEPLPVESPLYQRAYTVLKQLTNHQGFLMEEHSLSSTNAHQLMSNHKYKVSWISQGRRGLLLILAENIFFIEPSLLITDNQDPCTISLLKGIMNFPLPDGAIPTSQSKKQHRTLLDVVLVKDRPDPDTIQHRFMIRDILVINGGIVSNKPFHQRLKYFMDGVIQPRKRDNIFDYSKEPIHLRAYEFFDVHRLDYVLTEVCPKQHHGVQGIFFIPLDRTYFGNEDTKTFTWMNDSDFSRESLVDCVTGNKS